MTHLNPYQDSDHAREIFRRIEDGQVKAKYIFGSGSVDDKYSWKFAGGRPGEWAAQHIDALMDAGLIDFDYFDYGVRGTWGTVKTTKAGQMLLQEWDEHPFRVVSNSFEGLLAAAQDVFDEASDAAKYNHIEAGVRALVEFMEKWKK